MCITKTLLAILCFFILYCNALNCRSEGGPKEDKLKKIYSMCLKQQNNNTSNTDGHAEDNDEWRGTRRYNQKSQWNQDNDSGNNENSKRNYRKRERDRVDNESRMEHRDSEDDGNRMQGQEKRDNRDNRMGYVEKSEGVYRMDVRDIGQNGNNENRQDRNNGLTGRTDFFQNEDFGGRSRYDNYNNQYSTQPSRRYKRERRVEMNSGKRSQYNPNPQRFSGYEEKYREEEENSSETNSTKEADSKACALHCFLENLQMTDENGMPDRYLVTHTITKDVKDEDLKDFLQESIEECFQILDQENTDEKCEFSKNLLMCLSEKGRANCDDWKDDFQF